MAGYDELADVYEWLISDAKLTPSSSPHRSGRHPPPAAGRSRPRLLMRYRAAGGRSRRPGCAGGRHRRAQQWFAIVRRSSPSNQVHLYGRLRAGWDELPDHFDDATLRHGVLRRQLARTMPRVSAAGSRLWSRCHGCCVPEGAGAHLPHVGAVRAAGSRLDIRDQLVRLNGQVMPSSSTAGRSHRGGDQEHYIEDRRAGRRGRVRRRRSELLSYWSYPGTTTSGPS